MPRHKSAITAGLVQADNSKHQGKIMQSGAGFRWRCKCKPLQSSQLFLYNYQAVEALHAHYGIEFKFEEEEIGECSNQRRARIRMGTNDE